jgi:hypothetical protein
VPKVRNLNIFKKDKLGIMIAVLNHMGSLGILEQKNYASNALFFLREEVMITQ